ncbi:carbohydrate ABC transporter permease [Ruania zhangjianzhongii]|uniref:carbohydrate ABC transporter permease n=1 Tax=Ruania zhangjianzhongii TaxID=2603206 RepID=UPI0011CBB9C4|nr:carbohydrate ABC transporter permease [Ruania zhangjianzhongii]
MTTDRSGIIRRLGRHAVLIVVAVLMLYPVLWMLLSSLRPDEAIFNSGGISFSDLSFDNYVEGWNALRHPFTHYLINSVIITAGAIIGNLVSCSMAAYAFARLNFRANKAFFAIMLMTIMLPVHVLLVPQYVLFSELGWINTPLPLIVPKLLATDAFFVFLMVQFIRGIPRELDEAATIDGAGPVRIFVRIILPLTVPALATTAIFTFIWTWNDFLGPLIFLTDSDAYTVQLALRTFIDSSGGGGGSSWGSLFAMSTVSLLPVFVIFLVGQRYLVRGIATTGGK